MTIKILPEKQFWRLIDPKDLILHNVSLAKGWSNGLSMGAPTSDGGAEFVNFYGFFSKHLEKEEVWERVRADKFSEKPARNKCLFIFDSEEDADRALSEWYQGREMHKVMLLATNLTHMFRADAQWLNCEKENWERNSESYWSGEVTNDPRFEILASGMFYFPHWENPPFGKFF